MGNAAPWIFAFSDVLCAEFFASYAKCEHHRVLALPHPSAKHLMLCCAMAPLGFGFARG